MEWPLFGDVPEEEMREVLKIARRTFLTRDGRVPRDDPADSLI